MNDLEIELADLAATDRLGGILADVLPVGTTVALNGTLGSGKTRLVEAVAAALGVSAEDVTSPTFVLVREYAGRVPIYHFDAYRIGDDDEFLELGPDEYFDGEGLSLVEWGSQVESCLPEVRLDLELTPTGPTSRRARLTAHGERAAAALEQIAAFWAKSEAGG